jgi:hypothetical protein
MQNLINWLLIKISGLYNRDTWEQFAAWYTTPGKDNEYACYDENLNRLTLLEGTIIDCTVIPPIPDTICIPAAGHGAYLRNGHFDPSIMTAGIYNPPAFPDETGGMSGSILTHDESSNSLGKIDKFFNDLWEGFISFFSIVKWILLAWVILVFLLPIVRDTVSSLRTIKGRR